MTIRSIIPSRHTRRAWYYGLGARMGLYRQYGPTDRGDVRRLVFVCKGNICRSPFAEAVARAAGAEAVSYGLHARNDLQADSTAIRIARKFGLELETHRTKALGEATLTPGDLIVAMEPEHVALIDNQVAGAAARTVLLGMWCRDPQPYLFDPYGMKALDFERCFTQIEFATRRLISGG